MIMRRITTESEYLRMATNVAKLHKIQRIALELEKTQLKDKLKERVSDIAVQVEHSLVDKYCHVEYTSVFKRNRTRALKVIVFDTQLRNIFVPHIQ